VEEVEGVVEAVFVGFRVDLFEPCSDVGREVGGSFVVAVDVAEDEDVEGLSAEVETRELVGTDLPFRVEFAF
jgi:hypothetical protein